MKTIDLLPKLKKQCSLKESLSLKLPNRIQTFKKFSSNIREENLFDYRVAWEPFGSDCIGGLAYYGSKEDILNLEKKVLNYLENLTGGRIETQHYALWLTDTNALLILFEDYDNVYPIEENVLMVKFGAWTDDILLPEVIETYLYLEESEINNTWKVGSEVYLKTNQKHEFLRTNMLKDLYDIWPKYQEDY